MSLFDNAPLPVAPESGDDDLAGRPLADRMRPRSLDEYLGQDHILAPGKALRTQIENGRLTSLILWGPPGSGKTTLAALMARRAGSAFIPLQRGAQRDQRDQIGDGRSRKGPPRGSQNRIVH